MTCRKRGRIAGNRRAARDIVQDLLAREFLRDVHCVQQIIAQVARATANAEEKLAIQHQRSSHAGADPHADDMPGLARNAAHELSIERGLYVVPDEDACPGETLE